MAEKDLKNSGTEASEGSKSNWHKSKTNGGAFNNDLGIIKRFRQEGGASERKRQG